MIDIRTELTNRISRNRQVVTALQSIGVDPASCIAEIRLEIKVCNDILSRVGSRFSDVERRLAAFMKQVYSVADDRVFHLDAVFENCINISDETRTIGAICRLSVGAYPVACSAGKIDDSDGILPATLVGDVVIFPDNHREKLVVDGV